MRSLELSFDLILSSPYVRARQTADIVAEGLDLELVARALRAAGAGRGPGERSSQILRHERRTSDRILVVGHEPMLSSLISLLLSGEEDLEITLKKGGICKLRSELLRDDAPRWNGCSRQAARRHSIARGVLRTGVHRLTSDPGLTPPPGPTIHRAHVQPLLRDLPAWHGRLCPTSGSPLGSHSAAPNCVFIDFPGQLS